MSALADQRCWNHAVREAVVRCPSCKRFYCRECVTEHEGRMICASCMAPGGTGRQPGRVLNFPWIALALAGVLLAWLIFYYLGVYLARIPSDFFNGPA